MSRIGIAVATLCAGYAGYSVGTESGFRMGLSAAGAVFCAVGMVELIFVSMDHKPPDR